MAYAVFSAGMLVRKKAVVHLELGNSFVQIGDSWAPLDLIRNRFWVRATGVGAPAGTADDPSRFIAAVEDEAPGEGGDADAAMAAPAVEAPAAAAH